MDCDKLLSLGTELGCLLMSSGAEIYRAEESVNRLLAAYGLEPQVFAIPNCLFVSVITPGGQSINRMCRIPAHGTACAAGSAGSAPRWRRPLPWCGN